MGKREREREKETKKSKFEKTHDGDDDDDEKKLKKKTGMHASQGILTARGGLSSHAAVVARGW